jgi:hypothetical protein
VQICRKPLTYGETTIYKYIYLTIGRSHGIEGIAKDLLDAVPSASASKDKTGQQRVAKAWQKSKPSHCTEEAYKISGYCFLPSDPKVDDERSGGTACICAACRYRPIRWEASLGGGWYRYILTANVNASIS